MRARVTAILVMVALLAGCGGDGAVTTTAGTTATTIGGAVTTTAAATTTAAPAVEGIVATLAPAEGAALWFGPVAAVSAGEVWASVWPEGHPPGLIGHLKDGAWTYWRLADDSALLHGLAVAPDGTVWAATGSGAFSFDGRAWTRQYEEPVEGIAAGAGGEVWIGGWATCSPWVAQWQGGSWAVDQPVVDCACSGSGWGLPLAVSTDGDVWVPQQLCWGWGLMRYDGTAWEEIEIEGADQWVIEAGPAGEVWVLGMGARDSGQRPFARFDGEARTIYDWPFATSLRSMAVGPDGTVWIIYGTSLRSFDGTDWTTHVEGTEMSSIDVAPDGTVWYADEEGVHTLED